MKNNLSHKFIEEVGQEKKLTVIISIRVGEDRVDALSRLSYVKENGILPKELTVLIVDEGSPINISEQIISCCKENNYSYIRIDSEMFPFSNARARNAAALIAKTKHILFQDLDLIPYKGFYQEVLQEMELADMEKDADEFLMFGVVYLTEGATKEFFNTDQNLRKQKYLNSLLTNNKQDIEKFSTGTSVMVFNRYYYLSRGGNSEDFEKWGFEDIEFACRLLRLRKKFPLPTEFGLDYKNFSTINEYKGWKSIYRLFGDLTFFKGMVMFHAWHPVNNDGGYKKGSAKNRTIFNTKLREFSVEGIEPPPLPMLENGSTLILRANPWTTNREITPLLGNVIVRDNEDFNKEMLIEMWKEKKFDRVFFFNPYATERMMDLYFTCREQNIPYMVTERGALRDSIFFDPNGFNSDSSSYDSKYWDKPISTKEREVVFEYIAKERSEDDSLEEQSHRVGAENLKRRLNIPNHKKVLFVPLQRPGDTVIKYFSGRIGNYDNFIALLNDLITKISNDWVVVIKRHPLEVDTPMIEGAINADNVNIKDLLEIADKTLLINSGVGVLSLMWGVPVLHAGDAFYGKEDIAKNCATTDEVIDSLNNWVPSNEKVIRFLSYLINDFYSFGKFTTRKVKYENDTWMTATTKIKFYKINWLNTKINLPIRDSVEINSESILFDRYKGASTIIKKEEVNKLPLNKTDSVNKNQEKQVNFKRKVSKFVKNPKKFFLDSKNPLLHKIGYLLS